MVAFGRLSRLPHLDYENLDLLRMEVGQMSDELRGVLMAQAGSLRSTIMPDGTAHD